MKKSLILLSIFFIFASIAPIQASAATSAGLKPGDFFYIFDAVSEKINLFFTFNPENKAKKALEYADERLAEIEAISGENNPDAVKVALANYESNVALATEKSKEVKDKEQEENLLNLITDNASKNQEVLSAVLIKVPEEAREAIAQAIEASKRGQEEAMKQISELKGEIEQLKKEVVELKQVNNDDQTIEIEKLKKEVDDLKEKQNITQPVLEQAASEISKPQEQNKPESTVIENKSQTQTAKEEKKTITTLPNGAVVELDANGGILRIISQPIQEAVPPTNITTPVLIKSPKIVSVSASSTYNTLAFEWTTDQPTDSRIFISGNNLPSKIYKSESGLSTRHIVNISGLAGDTNYLYEIEAVTNGLVEKKQGNFSTTQAKENAKVVINLPNGCGRITNTEELYCNLEVSYFENNNRMDADAVTVTSMNSNAYFTTPSGYQDRPCTGGEVYTGSGQRRGSSITCPTYPSNRDGKPLATFTFFTRTLTTVIATINGVRGVIVIGE